MPPGLSDYVRTRWDVVLETTVSFSKGTAMCAVVRTFSFTNVLCPGIAQENEDPDKSSPGPWKMRKWCHCVYLFWNINGEKHFSNPGFASSFSWWEFCVAPWFSGSHSAYEIIIFPIFNFRHFSSPLCSTNQRRRTKVIKENKSWTSFVLW